MKATSIEQIREHLAKGGRALAVLNDGRTDEVKRVDMGMLRVYAGIWSSSFACVDVDHWQLLPLEEKEPVIKLDKKPHYSETENGGFTIEWEQNGRCVKLYAGRGYIFRCSTGGEGTGEVFHFDAMLDNREEAAKRLGIWLDWMEENEPVDHGTQKSKDSIDVEFIHADCTHETKSCLVMSAVSQMCEKCAERHRLVTSLRSEPDGTQKGPASAGQIIPGEGYVREAEIRKRIRTRLLHGHWPEMSDLLNWWEATTGERIEWGKRCDKCECSGEMPSPSSFRLIECNKCNGAGYSVRPTWMESEKE